MDRIDRVMLDDLDGDQRLLAEAIGIEGYRKLVQVFGGTSIYIRKLDSLLQNDRNRAIFKEFDGYNFRELAQAYNLSERAIREIVSDIVQETRRRPLDNQISFDDLK